MYSTAWCPVCAEARAFMNANGLSYSERDIDKDKNARDDLKRLTGKASIPTIEVDGELLTPGFSEQKVTAAVAASTKRRLGIKDLEIRRSQ
jgi:glutaredoxin 3